MCIRSSIGWRAEDCCTICTGVSSARCRAVWWYSMKPGWVSVGVGGATDEPVNGKGLSSRARLYWGSLCGFYSCGRRTSHRTTWRGTWVSRLGRWSTGPISSGTSVRRTRGDSRRSSVGLTMLGSRSSSSILL